MPVSPVQGRFLIATTLLLAGSCARRRSELAPSTLMQQVEVRRTAYGVPHIKAENFAALGYGEAYVQCEDYGARVAYSLLRARGDMGRWFGRDSMRDDFTGRLAHARAVDVYDQMDRATRDIYEGFAAGVNRYIELHAKEFPAGFSPHFTGYDVAAKDVEIPPLNAGNALLKRLDSLAANPNDGSNAWAFGPSRTTSGHAILLRNPHLVWTSGYYEAHLTVPGQLDFYGDLRIGGPFAVVGGFNRDLGFATTNNDPLLSQTYTVDADSTQADHYMLDGTSHALTRQVVVDEVRGAAPESLTVWRTSLGPVIARRNGKLYVYRVANDLEFRGGEQFLRMMRAHSLDEWKTAMRMRARINSSFTYADRAGNIYYVWNASLPSLPHPNMGDSGAIHVHRTTDAWTHYVPYDSLPQFLNPKGGYVHNENDAPYYTNMRQPLDPAAYPSYFPPPRLGLRSQLAISLIDNDRKLSLEDVIALKHSYRSLLAERVGDDLVAAVRATHPAGDVARAADLLAAWDKKVSPESRGGVLFETWWRRYASPAVAGRLPFAEAWSPSAPTSTPRGLRDAKLAAEAFTWAVDETKRRFGAFDVAWGDVHRVRRGNVDVPVGGCGNDLGCFRVLTYRQDPDGKLAAIGSDGWILAVEFGDQPRAYSVLAYGESPSPTSPWFSDQAAMFAAGKLKRVAWSEDEIAAETVRRYRPGAAR
jgi:acyl-homoserine-lactone acylase